MKQFESLEDARKVITHNEHVKKRYAELIAVADDYHKKNFIPIKDSVIFRQLGVIDYYRNRYSDDKKTDDEILKIITESFKKMEEHDNV